MGQIALPQRRPALAAAAANTLPPNELIPVLVSEGRRRIVPMVAIFAGIALLTLLIGLLVPQSYSASTTILAQESDIIQPLLEGRAVATGVIDRAGIARQVIYSRRVMEDILKSGGWLDENPTPLQRDRLMEEIQSRIRITAPRVNLVEISYRDSDARRTFEVTDRLAELFIKESLATKERESRDAYEFINKQVEDYHKKLTDAESNLQAYRGQNADAQPGTATDVNTRISSLRTQVEQTRMTLLEQQSRQQSLSSQLAGESAVTAVQTRDTLYRSQLMELQTQLDTLLLTFTDQYPDVVRIRHQMADIRRSMENEKQLRTNNPQAAGAFEDTQLNPHYQELRSQLAQAQRDVAATQSRMGISQSMLDGELDRSRRVAASESVLAELTRDYEVNRDLYQDLLRRRENARVSMELDREKRGLTLRVQDPAVMPLRPTGLRFMHIALAGLLLAIAVPLGLLFLLARFDPRIRSPRTLERQIDIPLLTVVPVYNTRHDRRVRLMRVMTSAAIVTIVVAAYAAIYGYKQLHA